MAKLTEPVYWLSPLGDKDDFGVPFGNVMYDAKTKQGPWANMSQASFIAHGVGRLGLGLGQKYLRQSNGRWLKVEG